MLVALSPVWTELNVSMIRKSSDVFVPLNLLEKLVVNVRIKFMIIIFYHFFFISHFNRKKFMYNCIDEVVTVPFSVYLIEDYN